MIIDNKFEIKQMVYLVTDEYQKRRMVTGITISIDALRYELTCGTELSEHFEFEISDKHNVMVTSTN